MVEDGALIIKYPTVTDTKTYECVATNEAGSVSTTFKTFIRREYFKVVHVLIILCTYYNENYYLFAIILK